MGSKLLPMNTPRRGASDSLEVQRDHHGLALDKRKVMLEVLGTRGARALFTQHCGTRCSSPFSKRSRRARVPSPFTTHAR